MLISKDRCSRVAWLGAMTNGLGKAEMGVFGLWEGVAPFAGIGSNVIDNCCSPPVRLGLRDPVGGEERAEVVEVDEVDAEECEFCWVGV